MPTTPSTEEIEVESEDLLFTPDFTFFPKGRHVYRQQGPYLVCRGCELHHAIYIGMEHIMVGEDSEGKPVLRRRSEL